MGRGTFLSICLAALLSACASGEAVRVPPSKSANNPFANEPVLNGWLSKPDGSGPFPAVVLLHGCSGLDLGTTQQATFRLLQGYAQRYVERGYVAIIVDSHGPRGYSDLCVGGSDTRVSYYKRAWDAAAAAQFLAGLGYVKADRIVVQGLSSGGSTALYAAQTDSASPAGFFAAAIAWYPRCEPLAFTGFAIPVLLLVGDADSWTPADQCAAIREVIQRGGGADRLTVQVYPGATHSYDYPYPARRSATGHMIAYDARATEQSWAQIDAFLTQHVQ